MDDALEWTHVGSVEAYRGFVRIESRRYRLPDGRETSWDVLLGGRTVAVVALTDANSVVLARQFRPGPGSVVDELPGGMVDPGEDIAAAAARELLEETGYAAASVEVVGGSWLAGFSTIRRYAAVARGCRKVTDPIQAGDESSTAVELGIAEFVAHVRSGELTDADSAYRCLDALDLLGG